MGAAVAERKIFDLATKQGRAKVLDAIKNGEEKDITDSMSLGDYLRTGEEPSLRCGKTLVFLVDEQMIAIRDGVAYRVSEDNAGWYSEPLIDLIQSIASHNSNDWLSDLRNPAKCEVVGFILDQKTDKYAKTIVRRGDEESNPLVNETNDIFPTVSVFCLAQMFYDSDKDEAVTKVAKKFAHGDLSVVNFIPDERLELTEAQKKQVAEYNREQRKAKPDIGVQMPTGKPGFSLVDSAWWHRSSTVLIHDNSDNTSYIFGQDEGTYFGCKLADNPTSVAAAFTSLIPVPIRGKTFQRQGEWFAVPVKESDVPAIGEAAVVLPDGCGLPILDPDSNIHMLYSDDDPFLAALIPRMSSNGAIFACNGRLEHDDHNTLVFKGWVRFYRNTALKSVSAKKNVD